MPVIQGLTKEQIRQKIGYQLPGQLAGRALYVGSATTVPGGGADTSSLIDAKLIGAANNHRGRWVVLNSMAAGDNNAGHIARVDSNTIDSPSSGDVDLTLVPAATDAIVASDDYELWDEEYDPAVVNAAMDAAVEHVTGRLFDPVEDISLFCDGNQARYSLPSDVYMIRKVQRRVKVTSKKILSFGSAMDESVDSDFTVSVDTEVKRRTAANKIVVGAGVSDTDKVTDSITAIDLSRYTHVEFWVRVTSDVAAGDLSLLLDDTAECASPVETLSIPAITASSRWTRVRIALATPHLCTAIISVGIEYTANSKANYIWVSDLIAIDADSEVYETMTPKSWDVDFEARELILKSPTAWGYGQIKIIGGDRPTLFTAETTVSEVPEEFIIAYAKAVLLMGKSDPNGREYSGPLFDYANRLMAGLPVLQGVRKAA